MKFCTTLLTLLLGVTAFAASTNYNEDFTAFLPASTDIAAASGDWTSDTGNTALSSTDATQLANLNADLGVVSTALMEVGSNTQLAITSSANHRVTTTMRLAVVRATSAPTGNAGDHLGFYVDDSTENAYIWHNDDIGAGGDQWLQLTGGPTIADGEWINLVFVQDYTHDRYTISINGTLISDPLGYTTAGGSTATGPWFNMVDQADNAIAQIEIEGSASAPTYVDEIDVQSLFVITADDEAGDGGGDAFVVTPAGGGFVTVTVNGTAYVNGNIPDSETITFEGSDDDDTVTLNFAGSSLPANISYNGGLGTDALNIIGNSAGATLIYNPTGLTSGSVAIDGTTLTFTGLDPITQAGTLANVIINDTPGAGNTITISQFSPTQTQATSAWESLTFTNPTTSFTLNADDGDDAIVSDHTALAGLGAAATMAIHGDTHAGGDTLTIDGQNNVTTDDLAGTITGTGWSLSYTTIETVTLNNNTAAVPALDFWGIVILSLSLLICGLRNLPGTAGIPVSGVDFRAAAPRAGASVAALYVAMLLFGSPVTMWDSIGLPLTFLLSSYLLAWVTRYHASANEASTQCTAHGE